MQAPRHASNCSGWLLISAVSSFSRRQQLYERYYSGDPVRVAGTLYGFYDKDSTASSHCSTISKLATANAGSNLRRLNDAT